MRARVIALTAGTLVLLLAAAALVSVPGYTDADYYYAIGLRLSRGHGFSQPFIWNYLAQPTGLPTPAHLYWMPLTSMLASVPLTVLGENFRNAQLIFILLAAIIPALSWYAARQFSATEDQQRFSWLLAMFPGYLLPFLVTTDAFGLFAVVGAGSLLALYKLINEPAGWRSFLCGILIGLSHLARADGFLLLLPAAFALWLAGSRRLKLALLLASGYLVVMGPWMIRLALVAGSPFPPGASNALWLRSYDELFSYPADFLKPNYLLGAGIGQLLADRLRSLATNLLSLLAVNHLVFLMPLTLVAAWHYRKHRLLQLAVIYLTALLIVMSFLFPLPGSRGGFFHSSAALMPLIWALAPLGLHSLVESVGPNRGWQLDQARRVFSWGMIGIAASVTGFLAWQRLIAPTFQQSYGWDSSYRAYQQIGEDLARLEQEPGVVAVNNPPGYWIATGQPAVVIPDGELPTLLEVAADFQVEWVVLEMNHPAGLDDLYSQPETVQGLEFVQTVRPSRYSPVHLFKVSQPP